MTSLPVLIMTAFLLDFVLDNVVFIAKATIHGNYFVRRIVSRCVIDGIESLYIELTISCKSFRK